MQTVATAGYGLGPGQGMPPIALPPQRGLGDFSTHSNARASSIQSLPFCNPQETRAAVEPLSEKRSASGLEIALTAEQEQLMLEHLSVVRYVARSIHERLPQHVELDELIGAGTLGLVDAARRFEADKNVQFRSYAQFRIRGAILDSLRSLDWSPRELRRKGRELAAAAHALQQRLGRTACEPELAAELGCSLGELRQLTRELRELEVSSLHAERGEETGEEDLAFVAADESESPLLQCLEAEKRRHLAGAIEQLPDRERTVMTLYYFEEMTMKQIGVVLGVVESRVSQIHRLGVARLRRLMADLCRPSRSRLPVALAARAC